MPKRSSKPKRPADINQNALTVVKLATEPKPRPIDASILSSIMSAMGKKGGKIGGKRRLITMTAEQRSQIALKAAKARWSKPSKSR